MYTQTRNDRSHSVRIHAHCARVFRYILQDLHVRVYVRKYYAKILARAPSNNSVAVHSLRAQCGRYQDFRPFHGKKHLPRISIYLCMYIVVLFFFVRFHKKKSRFSFVFVTLFVRDTPPPKMKKPSCRYTRGPRRPGVLDYAQDRYSYYYIAVSYMCTRVLLCAVYTVSTPIYFLVPGKNQDKDLRVCTYARGHRRFAYTHTHIYMKIRWKFVRRVT